MNQNNSNTHTHSESELKVTFLGGLGEIGMNCMALEYQDEIIIIDCGVLFSDLDHFGVELVVPNFEYLIERKEKVKAFLITHGHEDHIGALPFAFKLGVQAPIHASAMTSLMIDARMKENFKEGAYQITPFSHNEVISFKHFKVEPIRVNHSIVEASAFLIRTPCGNVIHTGDFRLDATPFYGEEIDYDSFRRFSDEGVLLLFSDSTNVEVDEYGKSESICEHGLEKIFAASEGMILTTLFSSNVSRMGQVARLAKRYNKKIVLSGRSVDQNFHLAQEAGYLKGAEELIIDFEDMELYPKKDLVVISTGCQGEYRSALNRIANDEHKSISLEKGDQVVFSSSVIPGNERSIGFLVNRLFERGADVIYDTVNEVHVSGHATRPELKKMLELIRPEYFVPVHGEYRHLVKHAELAKETGVEDKNVLIARSGDTLTVTPQSVEITEKREETRTYLNNRAGVEVSKAVLRERRRAGEAGVLYTMMVRNYDDGKIISGPEVVCYGVTNEELEPWLIEESLASIDEVLRGHARKKTIPSAKDLEEEIRIDLRRLLKKTMDKKVTVISIVIDV